MFTRGIFLHTPQKPVCPVGETALLVTDGNLGEDLKGERGALKFAFQEDGLLG